MHVVYLSDIKAKTEFVELAAAHFAAHPETITFADGEIEPGCWFAVRWGLGDDCVLVLKLDDTYVPEIYGQAIPRPIPQLT